MSFFESIASCLRQYATFSGRASRSEFWWFFLFQILLAIPASLLGELLSGLLTLAVFLPALAVGSRRLHDIGKSGWWQLLLITVIGFFVLVYWWVQPERDDAVAYRA